MSRFGLRLTPPRAFSSLSFLAETGPDTADDLCSSRAGVYGHLFNPNRPADFVYDDNLPDEIDQLDPDAPHRRVDMLFREASKQGLGKVVIAIPSTVYGGSEG